MTPTASSLEQLLGQIFDECVDRTALDASEYDRRRQEFIFHMTDVKEDFQKIAKLYLHPGGQSLDAESTFMIGFLYHVVPHLRAAGRSVLGEEVRDPFLPPDSPS